MSQISDPSTSGSPDILLTKFHRFTARAFRKLLSIYVFSYLPFGFEGRIWDLIGSVPDHYLSLQYISRKRGIIQLNNHRITKS